ncbi:MAG: response regulator [Ginsengibacter sp.]
MPGRNKNILVADDDEAVLDVLDTMLKTAGYNVTTMIDGDRVLAIKENLPDLILLDIWMAGIDGRDICTHLKNQSSTKHIPIIFISANRDTEEIATSSGADDFIYKPFDMDDLLRKVAKYLKKIKK